nr:immunoglobulin heavy chain junction region [Macaca mulatta]
CARDLGGAIFGPVTLYNRFDVW